MIHNTQELVNLMLKSSDNNPYYGLLSEKNNILAAIDLSNLFKTFADNGQLDESMNIESDQWINVINELLDKLNENEND